MNPYAIITNDVETTSLWNHCLSDKTGEAVLKEGLPLLLEVYKKYNIKATFFFTGYIASKFPEVVSIILPYGHEVGCHGYTHKSDKAFDILTLDQQISHLKKSKDILENICNERVISFRAPSLRVNTFTPKALQETGFLIDSSVAPQRMDMFFSFGSRNKLKWILAPRTPYYTDINDLTRKGNSNIFEIPVSSFVIPYTGTMMRLSPTIVKIVRSILSKESSVYNRPLVFLIHPNELIDEAITVDKISRRSKNYFSYLLGDKLRYQLKLKNLGKKAIPILESQLEYLSSKNFSFHTMKDYYELINNDIQKI